MCMVSNIGDQWGKDFHDKWPNITPHINPTWRSIPANPISPPGVTKEELDALRAELQELKKLLQAAKDFDAKTGQPHCEMDAKVKLIKEIAKLVGVDLADVFETEKTQPEKK